MKVALRRALFIAIATSIPLAILPGVAIAEKKRPNPAASPKAPWPPKGFKEIDGVYAKVPSTAELISHLSARPSLQRFSEQCSREQVACAAVFVAAERACTWWEVNSAVRRVNPDTLTRERIGSLVTYARGTDDREQRTIFLISQEPAGEGISVGNIRVICHRETTNIPKPGNVYNPIKIEES